MSEHAQESSTVIYDQLLTEFGEWADHHGVVLASVDPLVASTDDPSATQSGDGSPEIPE